MKRSFKNAVFVLLMTVLIFTGCGAPDYAPEDEGEFQRSVITVADIQSSAAEISAAADSGVLVEADTEASEEISSADAETSIETQSEDIDEEVSEETVEVRFRNKNLLTSHYEKHGIEMGFSSAQEYEEAACAVVNNKDALHKLEKEDGDDVYYLETTNEFVIVSTDGYLRTYFNPDRGKAYFDKQ